MQKFLLEVDVVAIKGVQEFSEWTQVSFGGSCYKWAFWSLCASYLLHSVFFLTVAVAVFRFGEVQHYWIGTTMSVLCALVAFAGMDQCYFARIKYNTTSKLPEPSVRERLVHAVEAIFLLLIAMFYILTDKADNSQVSQLIGFGLLIYVIGSWMKVAELYFASCTPLSPGDLQRRRIVKALQHTRGNLNPT
jgi:hypothetical protein